MKYLKIFESFNDIESICKKYGIKNYTINPDGSVDVDGDVSLSSMELTKLPLKFGRVSGNFKCRHNKLTTLEGAPKMVGGTFDCCNNQLTTLEGAPREVGRDFYCDNNKLTTLEGEPERVGAFYFFSNPIYTLYKLFNNYKDFMDSLDWNYIRGNKIIKSRFIDACEEAGIEVPESIEGYEYIIYEIPKNI
jgi:hypothetical protein